MEATHRNSHGCFDCLLPASTRSRDCSNHFNDHDDQEEEHDQNHPETEQDQDKSNSSANEHPTRKNSSTDNHNKGHDESSLSSFTLQAIAELINDNKIAKSSVIVMIGAGISISAGVPDLRSSDENIYAKLHQHQLKNLDDVFKLSYFKNNPAPFYDLSKNLLPSRLYPTLAHYFIRLLDEKGFLMRCYSQNVDCLESFCGLPRDKICLTHGSFEVGHCLRCNAEYEYNWMRQIVDEGDIPHCTRTPNCKGLIKPNIKFSGERIDKRFFRLIKEDFPKCELLILIGASLSMIPFNQLIDKVPPRCPKLYINKIKCGNNLSTILSRLFKFNSNNNRNSIMYDRKGNVREVFYRASCDDACLELANSLGWTGELIEMAKFGRDHLERLQHHQQQQPEDELDG